MVHTKKNTKWLHTANIFIVHLLLNLLEHVWAQTDIKQTNGICTVYYLQSFRYCPTIITISIILCFWSYFFEQNFILFIFFFWPFWAEHFIWHPWHIKIVNWCLLSVHLASATSTSMKKYYQCEMGQGFQRPKNGICACFSPCSASNLFVMSRATVV